MPLFILEFIEFVRLPVDGNHGSVCGVGNGRHLEGEYVVFEFGVGLPQGVGLRVEEESLIGELSVEAANDEDFPRAGPWHLADTTALPRGHELLPGDLEDLPSLLTLGEEVVGVQLETLDGVHVLLVFVGDPAEDVEVLILEDTARVVVASVVHGLEGHPLVGISVVDLHLLAGAVNVLTGACHKDEVLSHRGARVAVTSELHLCPLLEFELSGLPGDGHDLVHLEHALRKLVEVTPTNDENLDALLAHLDTLEVVGEVSLSLNRVRGHREGLSIVDVEPLRILLDDVDQVF